jgi:VanZ family protein
LLSRLCSCSEVEKLRTGHWAIEHFLAYFIAMFILCLGWPRPFSVSLMLIALAALLEVLQTFKPDHELNVLAALSSMVGVLAATPLVILFMRPSACFRRLDQESARSETRIG